MHREYLMGNEAIALGALAAGVNVVSGYPGTPSTECLETVARRSDGKVYVEWSVNEKAGLEVAAGAAMAGARTLVTMKQVGLNVAADPLMSLEYLGVKGAMVVLVADDPGPISSQTEQDTRTFAMFSKLPVFDPSTPAEAYRMTLDAFALSEKYRTPVFLRPTTRIDHGYEAIDVADESEYIRKDIGGFIKDPSRWVIFPRLSVKNHAFIEKRNAGLSDVFSDYEGNTIIGEQSFSKKTGIASQGASFAYLSDLIAPDRHPRILKIGTPFPFPEKLALEFMSGLDEIVVIEELDPFIERALIFTAGKNGVSVRIRGKLDGTVKPSGENTPDEIAEILNSEEFSDGRSKAKWQGNLAVNGSTVTAEQQLHTPHSTLHTLPALPARPPVLCAGCPHRASFYAVKEAMKGKKTIFCGDIGCYTLGNASPLDMCDTCLCMGAGINIAQGVYHVEPDTKAFAFVGDSTFFASGITGSVNGVASGSDMTICILDNSTTAMTGHQPHPGTGTTVTGDIVDKVDIEALLRGIGVKTVETVNPMELDRTVGVIRRIAEEPGFKAIVFKYPCVVRFKPKSGKAFVDPGKCVGCKKCINDLGCPALLFEDGKAKVDASQCTGCTLCEQVCPVNAISGGEARDFGRIVAEMQEEQRRRAYTDIGKRREKAVRLADIMKSGNVGATLCGRPDTERQFLDAEEFSIVFAGVGGQGTVLASRLTAAAAMAKGMRVRSAETIGMAQRGGSVTGYLKIGGASKSAIMKSGGADMIIGFEPAEALRALPYLKKGGALITSDVPVYPVSALTGAAPYDAAAVLDYLKNNVENLTLVDSASLLEKLGNDKCLNMLLLGFAVRKGVIPLDAADIESQLKLALPEKLWEVNIKALGIRQ